MGASTVRTSGYRHEAWLYAGLDDFLAQLVPFVETGLAADEAVVVAVPGVRLEALRRAVHRAEAVTFVDMETMGANPARIIAAWRALVLEHGRGGRPVRGIGEPIWAGRSEAELAECQRHEWLLNVAAPADLDFRLVCPYDVSGLGPDVIAEARRSHPAIGEGGTMAASPAHDDHGLAEHALGGELPEPAVPVRELTFEAGTVSAARRLVRDTALQLAPSVAEDLVLAVDEVVSNSIRHGGGRGKLRIWHEGDHLVCDVRDAGRFRDPMVGRLPPPPDSIGGRGIWIANQVCDLVQIRSGPRGSAVRLHRRTDRAEPAACG